MSPIGFKPVKMKPGRAWLYCSLHPTQQHSKKRETGLDRMCVLLGPTMGSSDLENKQKEYRSNVRLF